MTWIVRKELRELGPALALLVLAMLVHGLGLTREHDAVESYMWSCAWAGLALGGFHVWRDLLAESDAFLRHRALSWTAIRIARAAAGLLGMTLVAAVPWLPLLLVPGPFGYDIWTDVRQASPIIDLIPVHFPNGLAVGAFWWSLARFGGSVRRPRLRPVVAVAMLVIGFVATQSCDDASVYVVLVLGALAATGAVVFPAREVGGAGAARLVRPAALLALVIFAAAWLEASNWLRVVGRSILWQEYPVLMATEDGELRLVRASRIDDERIHVREWNIDRSDLLRDEIVMDSDYGRGGRELPYAHRWKSEATRRLHAGRMRVRRIPRQDSPLVADARPRDGLVGAISMERIQPGAMAQIRVRAGRVEIDVRRGREAFLQGSFGPDGWRPRGAPGDGQRFSGAAWSSGRVFGLSSFSFMHGRTLVIVDPERRAAYIVECVVGDDGSLPDPPLLVAERPLPAEAHGEIRPLWQFVLQPGSAGNPVAWRNILHLRCDSGLMLLDIDDGTSRMLPLEQGEEFGSWVLGYIDPDAPLYAVARPPYRDVATAIRVREQRRGPPGMPAGATASTGAEMTETDLLLTSSEPLERLAVGLLGAVTLARPPILNVASFAAPAPRTLDELFGRRLLDGVVTGGEGALWLLGSLLIGAVCALRNRRQARLRCETAAEVHAWTAIGLALGPMGLVWMDMIVRQSAVRATSGGVDLAVHVPSTWPIPKASGREVLLTS